MATGSELTAAIMDRYRSARRADKRRILDEFVAVAGHHRKHAICVLNRREPRPPSSRSRNRHYDEDVRDALIVLWEASDPA